MSNDSPILLERDDGIATLRFNRPAAYNAIDRAMASAFLGHVKALAADASVRAIVMAGNGKAFVSGGDLSVLRDDPVNGAADLIGPLHEGLQILASGDAPVIASVHGAVAGAGLSLMLQADYVVAAEGTKFNLAYVNVGTSCDVGASWALPRIVGQRKALEIAMLGETCDAAEALRLSMVNRVVPGAELAAATKAIAGRFANGPTRALGELRRLIRTSLDRDLRGQLDAEAQAFARCAQTDDFREGTAAFFEKRAPEFRGR
ncbi:enoyl-CoA hydratase/isomerase family protein [Variovorax sp. VNK109]|uniref:enoyl-CoA hydratase/isomerase family protein n=1 Tax=Variovorax sp. VNK109 TaxID=3400919 RepID=UPI003C10A262